MSAVKETLSDLLDVLAEPSLSEPVRSVWAVADDELDNLPNPLPDNAAQACRDALRPADGLGKPAQWTGRDWAKAAAALVAWGRCKGLNGLGKSWIAKLGGSAPDNHDAGTREMAGLLYRRLLDAVSPKAVEDRLSGRQRALLLATISRGAREMDVSLSEKVEHKKSLAETPEAYVADLIRRGLLERGGPGAASVVPDWPAVLDDRSKFRDSFWSELRELVEPPGKAAIPLAAAGIALVALLIALMFAWGKSSKTREELEIVGKAVREVAKDSLKNTADPTAGELAEALAAHDKNRVKALETKLNEVKTLGERIAGLQKQLTEKGDLLTAAAAARKDIETNLEQARKDRDGAKAEVEKLTASLKETAGKLSDSEKAARSTKADLDKTAGEREKLAGDLKGVRDQLAKAQGENKNVKAVLDAADAALARTKTDLAKKQDDLKRADAGLVNANEALRSTTERLGAAEKNLNTAKAEIKDALTKLKASNDAVVKVEGDRDKARAEGEKTRTELKGVVAKLADADRSLTVAAGEKQKAAADLAGLRNKLAAADKDLAGARDGKAKADSELAKVRTDLETARKDLAAGRKDADDKVRKSADEAAKLRAELDRLKKEIDELRKSKPEPKDPKQAKKTDDPAVKKTDTPATKDNPAGDATRLDFLGAVLRNPEGDKRGALVVDVKAGSKAAAAGLKTNDLIVELRADFLVGNMVLSQEVKIAGVTEAGAFVSRVGALKRDNKFKCWHVKLADRTVVIEE